VTAHPVLHLSEEDVLLLGVAQQIVKFNRWFGSLNHIVKFFVCFLDSIESCIFINVLDAFHIELVVEAFDFVAEVGLWRNRLDSA